MGDTPSERMETNRADRDLAARCRRDEAGAFEELYRQHGRRVYTVAYRMTGSAADAEDLTQEVFLLAFRRIGGYRGEAALGTWLHRMAVNTCLDYARSKQGRRQRATDAVPDLDAVEPAGRGPWRADMGLDRLDLERAVSQLPPSYRRAFLLHDVEGLQHNEIGAALGIAEGTSKSLVHKARTRLRALLRGGPAGAGPAAAGERLGAS